MIIVSSITITKQQLVRLPPPHAKALARGRWLVSLLVGKIQRIRQRRWKARAAFSDLTKSWTIAATGTASKRSTKTTKSLSLSYSKQNPRAESSALSAQPLYHATTRTVRYRTHNPPYSPIAVSSRVGVWSTSNSCARTRCVHRSSSIICLFLCDSLYTKSNGLNVFLKQSNSRISLARCRVD